MNRWYRVYLNDVFQYYSYGEFMKVTQRANMLFQFRDIVTVLPSDEPFLQKPLEELLKEGYDIDIRITMKKED